MILAVALIVSEAARQALVPAPLLAAVAEVQRTEPLLLGQALRVQADRVFAAYPALAEERLSDWHEAVMLSCPSPDFRDAAAYAAAVYTLLRDGSRGADLDPQDVSTPWPLDGRGFLAAANFTAGREDLRPSFIVIHDMEGFYHQTLRHFLEPHTAASAHFSIRASDGAITEHVPELDTAWHAGNWEMNLEAIGIEHEGFADSPFSEDLYRASAALTRFLCDRFDIPKDRNHIIGHYEVPDPHHPGWYGGAAHHSDPCDAWAGEPSWHNVSACRWDWDRYLLLVRGR